MSKSNSHRSGGPKTSIGKKRSSQNARRHGILADEFSFSAAEEIEFAKLNVDLREVLKPNNALLDLIFQHVLACGWRMRLALRLEQTELRRQCPIENEEGSENPQEISISHSLQPRQRAQYIELLDSVLERLRREACLPPEFEAPITQLFGPGLWKILAQWRIKDPKVIWMAQFDEHVVERDAIYGLPPWKKSPQRRKRSSGCQRSRAMGNVL